LACVHQSRDIGLLQAPFLPKRPNLRSDFGLRKTSDVSTAERLVVLQLVGQFGINGRES
jgi:hypothetical protein